MNKNVLITGSSKGIGLSIAYKFASLGYNIILNSRNIDNTLSKDIEAKYNVKVRSIKGDISNESDVINMFKLIKKEFKSIDVLVNNASISLDNDLKDKSVLEFKKVIDTNLIGTFIVTKYALEIMNKGSIINIASTNGIDTFYPESIDYDASKAGIISLTKNYAKYLAPNIRVNAIAPGWVDTDMNKDLNPLFKEEELNKIFLKRFAKPEEIASVVAFLASDEANYITGSIIRVDGGY